MPTGRARPVSSPHVVGIESDIVAEGRRLVDLTEREGARLRLLGGVAIKLRTAQMPPVFERAYGDLDLVAARGAGSEASAFLAAAGYEADRAFNVLHGSRRQVHYDVANGRKIDVFVGEFAMCHRIPVGDRLLLERGTLPLAELLLTKLQVVELNEKDVRDTLALVHGHETADRDGDAVNAERVAELCASDWGLWRTITRNLVLCHARVGDYEIPAVEQAETARRLETLLDRVEQMPKSRGWRLRARVGERVRWYELPEELGDGV